MILILIRFHRNGRFYIFFPYVKYASSRKFNKVLHKRAQKVKPLPHIGFHQNISLSCPFRCHFESVFSRGQYLTKLVILRAHLESFCTNAA